jgi:undecaprenyl-diphosphatase
MLLVTGIILFISDKFNSQRFAMPKIGWKRSVIIGLGQSFAMFPGLSRSGTTIAVGIFSGLKREDAARFSFLLSVPAILGANILKISELSQLSAEYVPSYLGGAIAAFISGYAVISWLLKLVKKSKLKYFSYYCWLLAIISIVIYSL